MDEWRVVGDITEEYCGFYILFFSIFEMPTEIGDALCNGSLCVFSACLPMFHNLPFIVHGAWINAHGSWPRQLLNPSPGPGPGR